MDKLAIARVNQDAAIFLAENLINQPLFFYKVTLEDNVFEVRNAFNHNSTDWTFEDITDYVESLTESLEGFNPQDASITDTQGQTWYAFQLKSPKLKEFIESWDGHTFTKGTELLLYAIKENKEQIIRLYKQALAL